MLQVGTTKVNLVIGDQDSMHKIKKTEKFPSYADSKY